MPACNARAGKKKAWSGLVWSACLHRFSFSTKIAALRRLLAGELNVTNSEVTEIFKEIKRGERRVVIEVHKADWIAALIRLKREDAPGMRMTILGGHESWMVRSLSSCSVPKVYA